MYRLLFVILFAGAMWLGVSKLEILIAASTKSYAVESTPTIGLGPFLLLVRVGNIVIIDMRESQDYDRSRIKDAVSVHRLDGAGADENLQDRLRKARNIVLYSNGGVTDQMRRFAQTLSKRGIEGVAFYSGGFREWVGAGLPAEKQ